VARRAFGDVTIAEMRFASAPWITLFALAKPCFAQQPPTPPPPSVKLDVISESTCASKTTLMARVRARLPNVRFVDERGGLEMRAKFTELASGRMAGELVLVDGTSETALRQFEAPSCQDAVDGVALILAITLDPTAVERAAESTVEPPPEASTTEPAAETPDSAGVKPTGGATPVAVDPLDDPLDAPDGTEDAERPREAGPARDSGPWQLAGFVAGEAAWGPAPDLMPGFAAYALLAFDRASAWSPAVGLGGIGVWSRSSSEWGGTASFSLAAATVDACALRFALNAFEVRLCGSSLIGRLSATGTDAMNETTTVPGAFVSAGASGLLSWDIGAGLALGARLSSRANLVRDEFEFRPRVFHRVSALTLAGDLGLGLRWP
jgi:hypothetical protein